MIDINFSLFFFGMALVGIALYVRYLIIQLDEYIYNGDGLSILFDKSIDFIVRRIVITTSSIDKFIIGVMTVVIALIIIGFSMMAIALAGWLGLVGVIGVMMVKHESILCFIMNDPDFYLDDENFSG